MSKSGSIALRQLPKHRAVSRPPGEIRTENRPRFLPGLNPVRSAWLQSTGTEETFEITFPEFADHARSSRDRPRTTGSCSPRRENVPRPQSNPAAAQPSLPCSPGVRDAFRREACAPLEPPVWQNGLRGVSDTRLPCEGSHGGRGGPTSPQPVFPRPNFHTRLAGSIAPRHATGSCCPPAAPRHGPHDIFIPALVGFRNRDISPALRPPMPKRRWPARRRGPWPRSPDGPTTAGATGAIFYRTPHRDLGPP